MKALASLAVAGALLAAPASAVTVFEDNFDYGDKTEYSADSSVFGYNWFTSSGSVDYIADGSDYDVLCPGETNCVDLDGSNLNGGTFSTTKWFGPGIYTLIFQLIGNQRNETVDTLTVSFGGTSASLDIGKGGAYSQLDFGDGTTFFEFLVTEKTRLTFTLDSNDNEGPILKYVEVDLVAPVPVPAAGALMLGGLGLLGLARRRKAKA